MRLAVNMPDDFSIWHFHRLLLQMLLEQGHEVITISPEGPYVASLKSLGAEHLHVPMARFFNLRDDLQLIGRYYRAFKECRPDIVHNFTIKPNIFGAIAARLAGVPKTFGTLEGLGFLYGDKCSPKFRMLRPLVNVSYKLASRLSQRFWFVNPDDMAYFTDQGIISRKKAFLTIGTGVDLADFQPAAIRPEKLQEIRDSFALPKEAPVVTLPMARVIWSKGVGEYVEAAARLRQRFPGARFLLVGPLEEDNPDGVPGNYLREHERQGDIQWLGFQKNIKEIYAISDLVVLPSYYREGVPNVLLEAMAMGLPIVTTDNVGCREVIEDGRTGYLVPPRDTAALAAAMEKLLADEARRRAFGANARRKTEEEFDKRLIYRRVLKDFYGDDVMRGADSLVMDAPAWALVERG